MENSVTIASGTGGSIENSCTCFSFGTVIPCPIHNKSNWELTPVLPFVIPYTTQLLGPAPVSKQPYKCPVCNGTALVSTPPYVAGDQSTYVTNGTGPYLCRAGCVKGVLWA